MAEVLNCLSAWLAPVLSFTAEEAWSHRPEGVFGEEESVHLREFPNVQNAWQNESLAEKWSTIRAVRKSVLEAIEPLRADKTIGSSLEALPVISTEDQALLESVNMADVCITSGVQFSSGTPSVIIEKAPGEKCTRCWKVLPEVEENGDLCNRCSGAVAQAKEKAA